MKVKQKFHYFVIDKLFFYELISYLRFIGFYTTNQLNYLPTSIIQLHTLYLHCTVCSDLSVSYSMSGPRFNPFRVECNLVQPLQYFSHFSFSPKPAIYKYTCL